MSTPIQVQHRTADPNSMRTYLEDLEGVVHDAAVDYHRVGLDDPVDEVLARLEEVRAPLLDAELAAEGGGDVARLMEAVAEAHLLLIGMVVVELILPLAVVVTV